MLLEVSLIGSEHTVEPWEELLSAVIGVKNNGTGGVGFQFDIQ